MYNIYFSSAFTRGVPALVFTAETKEKIYDVIVLPDGKQSYQINCCQYDELPNSPAPNHLKKLVEKLMNFIKEYLSLVDCGRKRSLWWFLKDKTENNDWIK